VSARKPKRLIKGRRSLSHDPAVVRWVRERTVEGWTRDRIVAASKAGTDGWPVEGESLSNGGMTEVRAALAALEQAENEEAAEALARSQRASHAATQASQPRPLSAHFWRLMGDTGKWERALAQIQDQLSTLSEAEQTKVGERLERLRDRCEAGLRMLGEGPAADDVIEGTIHETRELLAG
jgi:hypothetical protein